MGILFLVYQSQSFGDPKTIPFYPTLQQR